MSDTTKVTVHFTGSITYNAAPLNSKGQPYPTTPDGHAKSMASDIEHTLSHELTYGPESLEEADYVQKVHELTVTGVTVAEAERLARLEKFVEQAGDLYRRFQEAVGPITDQDGNVKRGEQGWYDRIMGDYEYDAWPLVQSIALLAKGGE